MDKKHTREELADLVKKRLAETGIDPKTKTIGYDPENEEGVIPNHVLHQYDPKDVLCVAADNGFMIAQCSFGDKYKANGAWIEPDKELLNLLVSYSPLSHSLCPDCVKKYYPD